MKRVVVTGLGLLTSIGDGVENTWDNLILCKSGIRKISIFDTENLSCKIAGYISHNPEDDNFFNQNKYFNNREVNRNDRFILYGMAAAEQAIKDAGIDIVSDKIKLRTGVTVGSGIGGLETIYNGLFCLLMLCNQCFQ